MQNLVKIGALASTLYASFNILRIRRENAYSRPQKVLGIDTQNGERY